MELNDKGKIIYQILSSNDVENSIRENEEVIFEIIPLLRNEKGFIQNNPWHMYDVWNHTIKAISFTDDFEERLIMLLHDIGKPFSFQDDSKGRHFNGHANKSLELSKEILISLGITGDYLGEILYLIGEHATDIDLDKIDDRNIDLYLKLINIQICDGSAYEKEHSKMILEKLKFKKSKICDKVYKLKYKK